MTSDPGLPPSGGLPPSLTSQPNIDLQDQTIEQLRLERDYWRARIDQAPDWAPDTNAHFYWQQCIKEINRREAA